MENQRKLLLKYLIAKVLKGLPFLTSSTTRAYSRSVYLSDDDDEESNVVSVPEDVREGYFAVIAMQGEERKRFVVELDYLSDPAFLRLLEKAGEEYGYKQKGAIAVPCRPQELHNIIHKKKNRPSSIQ